MMWRSESRRRRRFIDQKQQVRFAVEVGLYTLMLPLIVLLMAVGSHVAAWGMGMDDRAVDPLLNAFLHFCLTNWWGVLLALVLVGYMSVWYSHKIFGPLNRFQQALEQKQRDPQQPVRCRLRAGDYFHEFSTHFESYLNHSEPAAPVTPPGTSQGSQAAGGGR